MAQKGGGSGGHTPPSTGGNPSSSLSLPTANTARRHLGTKKKSDTKQIHPGYSMFDWNKICDSGRDMPGTGGQLLKVTPDELARHCTDTDLWTAVRGVVYNITLFTKYHPGGKAQLMRGAGHDCTELFDKIHVWVNSESILEKCIVGYLVGVKPSARPSNLAASITKPPFPGGSSAQNDGEDVLSLSVPTNMTISDAGNLGDDSDEESEISIPVPMFNISDESPIPRNDNIMVIQNVPTTPRTDALPRSTPATDISIPVPNPTPISGISIPVPKPTLKTVSIPVPVPTDRGALPAKSTARSSGTSFSGLGRIVGRYVSTHPLISTTAYETAV